MARVRYAPVLRCPLTIDALCALEWAPCVPVYVSPHAAKTTGLVLAPRGVLHAIYARRAACASRCAYLREINRSARTHNSDEACWRRAFGDINDALRAGVLKVETLDLTLGDATVSDSTGPLARPILAYLAAALGPCEGP